MATPVGFLYTPQQLAGSVRYGSGVLLGNWREDDALGEKRAMDHIDAKETGSLCLLKKQSKLAPQLVPVPLTPAPSDGITRIGDTVLLQSLFTGKFMAVSLGQVMRTDDPEAEPMFIVVGSSAQESVARNALKLVSYDGSAAVGTPLLYGQKVCLEFSGLGGMRGYLASERPGCQQLASTIINKQEAFMRATTTEAPSYNCAWEILPQHVDDRIVAAGTPMVAGAPFVLVHCFTNKRLASVNVTIPTDFGLELGVCCHTYASAAKINKLMRETIGRPTNNLISREEADENMFGFVYS